MSVPGYQITIHNSLTNPILMAGVPRQLAILNGTIWAAATFGLQTLYATPICLGVHVLAVFLTKKDPYFFQAMLKHLKQKSYYDV